MHHARYVIIGAGFAGAATAYHLAMAGEKDILILEREPIAGTHSSGRNAAMVRQIVPDHAISGLARASAAFIRKWAREPHQYRMNGSLLLYKDAPPALLQSMEEARQAGVKCGVLRYAEAVERVNSLHGADFNEAIYCATDGVVDAAALLTFYLSEAQARGAKLITRKTVTGFKIENEQIVGVQLGDELVRCETVINAAGPWAGEIGRLAQAGEMPMRVTRRHLFATPPISWVDVNGPFVWDVTHEVYFRPETTSLLTRT